MVYLIFIFFYVIAVTYQFQNRSFTTKKVFQVLAFACVVLTFIAGFRDYSWPDTIAYVYTFEKEAKPIWEFSPDSRSIYFGEPGFFLLGFIVKTFTENTHIYLTFVSALTFLFLYYGIKKFSVLPLLGLVVYVARFFLGRNMAQIRAGLCYAIILFGLQYIQQRKLLKFLLVVFIAYQFHHSAIIALPVYFICNYMKLHRIHIVLGLIAAFVVGIFFQDPIHAIIQDNASDLKVDNYVEGGTDSYIEGKGISNPLIYFQCFFLLIYTFWEKRLAPLTKYYYVIRDGYFYSTVILIVFCTYSVISGRTSTMFATMEIAIIPSIICLFPPKQRLVPVVVLGLMLTAIFIMNYPRLTS